MQRMFVFFGRHLIWRVVTFLMLAACLGLAGSLFVGVGGCGGTDEGATITAPPTKKTSDSTGGTSGGSATGEIIPTTSGGTTSGGTGSGGTGSGGTTTGGSSGGSGGSGGSSGSGGTGGKSVGLEATFGGYVMVDMAPPTVTNVTPRTDGKGFTVQFSEPVDFNYMSANGSIWIMNDAHTAAVLLARIFSFGAVLPFNISATLVNDEDVEHPKTVDVMTLEPLQKILLKDKDGKYNQSPYHLIVWGADSKKDPEFPNGAARDVAGNLLQHEDSREFECGTGKGYIPCDGVVKVPPEESSEGTTGGGTGGSATHDCPGNQVWMGDFCDCKAGFEPDPCNADNCRKTGNYPSGCQ